MNIIRFACPKCGQHLACEPESQGMQIACPACKKPLLVVTEKICASYRLLELEPGAPLLEVKNAHRERIKLWDEDRFPDDARFKETAKDKRRELNAALAVITAYLADRYSESMAGPGDLPESKMTDPSEARRGAGKAAADEQAGEPVDLAFALRWVFAGMGSTLLIGLLAGLVMAFAQRGGPTLTDDSTPADWLQAKERAKRVYCRSALLELEQKGVLRQYHVRVGDKFLYEGLNTISHEQKPDDAKVRLVDLCVRLVAQEASGFKVTPVEPN